MATNVQSQSHTELKCYLEDCLHAHFPAASNQEITHAVEVAMGGCGYMLDRTHIQSGQQNCEQLMNDNSQFSVACACLASVRDAAISAAQSLSESSLRMAAVACAWACYAATCALAEQMDHNQQRAACNQQLFFVALVGTFKVVASAYCFLCETYMQPDESQKVHLAQPKTEFLETNCQV